MITPHENLTREEADLRAGLLEDIAYEVHLDLTQGDETFLSRTETTFACTAPGAETFIDLTANEVLAVTLNGEELSTEGLAGQTRVRLANLRSSNQLTVVARMNYQHEGKGLHFFRDPTDQRVYLHSQFQPFDAHLVFACFDQPDLKATFAFEVEAPEHWVVVSNEPTVSRPPDGQAGLWRFAVTPPLSTYVTAVVAGEYHRVEDSHGGVELGLYVRQSLAEHLDSDDILLITKQGLDWYDANFGISYPFTKYDQLFVPEFSAGAMENPGCVTFSELYIFRSKVTDAQYERRAETILHEMAHMWFGDLVTMRWWDDLWLNESFATFSSVLSMVEATRFDDAWVTFLDAFKNWAKFQDELPTTHPIATELPDVESVHQNFDGITYAKGASVLRQLVAWVGQDAFLAGCREYFETHQWANATEADFLRALEAASGRDLTSWRDAWLTTSGVNTLRPEYTLTDDDTIESFVVHQTAVEANPTLRPHRVSIGVYDDVDGALQRVHRVEVDVDGPSTQVPSLSGVEAGSLVLVNDDDLTFAKASLDQRSMDVLTRDLHLLDNALPRALVWGASWDMVRDGSMAATRLIEMVVANLGAETDIGVLQRLALRATAAAERYSAPANRVRLLSMLADQARSELEAAAPGSGHQLVWARQFGSCAREKEDVAQLAALYLGKWEVKGLELDTELRWHLLTSLARTGEASDADIATELARDATDIGERHALTARASRPDPGAKAAAWARLLEDTSLSHTLSRHVWGGFQQLSQPELIDPYVEPYFDALTDIWATRSLDWAIEFTEGMFPHPAASPELAAITSDYLTREGLPSPLRRALVEQQDVLQRTLRARSLDAAA